MAAGIVARVSHSGRYACRRIAAMLRLTRSRTPGGSNEPGGGTEEDQKTARGTGFAIALKVPRKQTRTGRLWLGDGSCIRRRQEHPSQTWSCDFDKSRTPGERWFRMLKVIDEFARWCLAIRIDRKLNSNLVIDVLTGLVMLRGVPGHGRPDHGPERIEPGAL